MHQWDSKLQYMILDTSIILVWPNSLNLPLLCDYVWFCDYVSMWLCVFVIAWLYDYEIGWIFRMHQSDSQFEYMLLDTLLF